MTDIKLLSQDKKTNKTTFLLTGTTPSFANLLRRMSMEEVPTMAIDVVEFRKNSSAIYDEVLAHRIGLVAIATDLKSYVPRSECTCENAGCAKCSVVMTLKAKGPGYVYASSFESKDPKIKPIYGETPIAKLAKGQELELEATATLGKGKEHAKHSPGLAYYRYVPELKSTAKSDVAGAAKESKNLVAKGNKIEIKDLVAWNDADEQICEENGIEITSNEKDFIFTIEPWGQLSAKEIVTTALEEFESKLDEMEKQLK